MPVAMSIRSDIVAGMGSAGELRYLLRRAAGTSISLKVMALGRLVTALAGAEGVVGNGDGVVSLAVGERAGMRDWVPAPLPRSSRISASFGSIASTRWAAWLRSPIRPASA